MQQDQPADDSTPGDAPAMTDALEQPPMRPQPLAPVSERERIVSLDVLRGVAIFGIFLVNMAFFAHTMPAMMNPALLAHEPLSEQLAWAFVKVFAEFKFISLFSLLFGIGLIVQMNRAQQSGRALGPAYMRRLIVLAMIGLIHGILIWYGDILFMYAVGGLVLFFVRGLSGRTLLGLSIAAFALSTLIFIGFGALAVDATGQAAEHFLEQDEPAEVHDQAADVSGTPRARWSDAFERWQRGQFNVFDRSWHEMEMIAYREGPMEVTIATRSIAYAGHVFFAGVFGGFGLRILALFLLGAALMKWQFFSAENHRLHRQVFAWAISIGLALELLVAWIYFASDFRGWGGFWADSLHWFSSLVLMFGYVGGICVLVHSGALQWLTRALGAVGRMALTNYIGQSVVATFVMYWWGLGLFGEFSRAEQVALVVVIFFGQIIFSLLWLSAFRFGPLEWVWRCLAYWKWQPLR